MKTGFGSLVAAVWAAGICAAAPAPHLRHVNYAAIAGKAGEPLCLSASCIAHGYRAYQDALRARLVRFDGEIVRAFEIGIGESTELQFTPSATGRYALELNSGWNLSRMDVSKETPYAYRSGVGRPLETVREWGPLYFHVPKGTGYFNIWVSARVTKEGAHVVIRNPESAIVHDQDADFDTRTKIQLRVSPGHAGAPWSIELVEPEGDAWYTDDVAVELGRHLPPFLAPRPEWATLFAGNWAYDEKEAKAKQALEAPATVAPPFHGTDTAEVNAAYQRTDGSAWRTALPFTYVLDYGPSHLGNAQYVPEVASAPPTLLHLGKDVPFNHGWGPIQALGGENQAYGYGEHITRLTPDQVRERIDGLRTMVDQLHEAGVRWVTPYICAMTLNGDEKRRSGFWEFYDHWNEYRSLGLGPRPAADPFEWLQTTADGKPRIYYPYDYPNEYYPRFKTNHRYAACWYTEGWRTWLLEVVRFAATCGYDGLFVDNGTSQRTMSPTALAAFRAFLSQHYTAEQAREMLGVESIAETPFPESKTGGLLYTELQRFWAHTCARLMAAVKETGTRELGREFVVFPNGGRPGYIQRGLAETDFVMFEKSHGEYGTHPGTVFSPVFEGVELRSVNDNIFEHKFVQSLRRRVRPIILSRAGYPKRLAHLRLNADAARLGFAECGAFSGGGGFLVRPRFRIYGNALNEYRRFFESHPGLFAGMVPLAPVAVLAFPEQTWLGNAAHMGLVRTTTRELAERHVLFEFISEDRLSADALSQTSVLLAPDVRCLSDTQVATISAWVRAGGKLVLVGAFGSKDEAMRENRLSDPLLDHLEALENTIGKPFGKGLILKAGTVAAAAEHIAATHDCAPAQSDQTGRALRLNAYTVPNKDGESRSVIHLVNYNVTLGAQPPAWASVENVDLTLPQQPAWKPRQARIYRPEKEGEETVPVRTSNGRSVLTVPHVSVYAVIELTP